MQKAFQLVYEDFRVDVRQECGGDSLDLCAAFAAVAINYTVNLSINVIS